MSPKEIQDYVSTNFMKLDGNGWRKLTEEEVTKVVDRLNYMGYTHKQAIRTYLYWEYGLEWTY